MRRQEVSSTEPCQAGPKILIEAVATIVSIELYVSSKRKKEKEKKKKKRKKKKKKKKKKVCVHVHASQGEIVRRHRHKSVISTLKDGGCDAPLPVKKTTNEQTALTIKTMTPEVATEAACRASRSAARQLRPGGPRRQPQGKQKHHDDGCKERGRRRAADRARSISTGMRRLKGRFRSLCRSSVSRTEGRYGGRKVSKTEGKKG